MDTFQDLRILPSPDFTGSELLSAVFQNVHKALAAHGHGQVGVSFPQYSIERIIDGHTKCPPSLGSIIRLHGLARNLAVVVAEPCLARLRDYIQIAPPQSVPQSPCYRSVRRVQAKTSAARLLRRSVRKGWITEAEASARLKLANDVKLNLPYLQLSSASTGQRLRVYIELGPIMDRPIEGEFSSYGLSSTATIPWLST